MRSRKKKPVTQALHAPSFSEVLADKVVVVNDLIRHMYGKDVLPYRTSLRVIEHGDKLMVLDTRHTNRSPTPVFINVVGYLPLDTIFWYRCASGAYRRLSWQSFYVNHYEREGIVFARYEQTKVRKPDLFEAVVNAYEDVTPIDLSERPAYDQLMAHVDIGAKLLRLCPKGTFRSTVDWPKYVDTSSRRAEAKLARALAKAEAMKKKLVLVQEATSFTYKPIQLANNRVWPTYVARPHSTIHTESNA